MIELDGVEYNIKTPEENALDIANYINNYCETNEIKNKEGELISIEQNTSNPLYMMIFGLGYLVSNIQQLIYSAGAGISINESSERQLLNLADIANVKRRGTTRTTIHATVYAEVSNVDEEGVEQASPCAITFEEKMEVAYGSKKLTFTPAFELTEARNNVIPVGGAANIILICDQEGSYSISGSDDASFTSNPQGFRKMITQDSSPGLEQETIQALRARLQSRDSNYTQIDGAIIDIESLDGVSSCNIYFNYSSTMGTTINDVYVPPRQALLCVQGYSDKIAETFYNHLFCLTAGEDSERNTPQTYTTLSGQEITVNILSPVYLPIYVTIHLKGLYSTEEQENIKDTICSLASSIAVGDQVTSAQIIKLVQDTYPSYTVQGCYISTYSQTDNQTYVVTPSSSELITFSVSNIRTVIDSE